MLSPGLIVRGKRRSIDLLHLRRLSSTTKEQSEVVVVTQTFIANSMEASQQKRRLVQVEVVQWCCIILEE